MIKFIKIFMLAAVVILISNSAAYAEESAYVERINLSYHSSKYINLHKNISTIWCGSKILRIHQPTDSMSEIVITAQSTKGSTTVFIWTEDGLRYEYLVNVTDEETGLSELIEAAINLPDVHVKKVGDRILLTGTVKNQYERNLAIQTARLYVGSGSDSSLSFGSTVNMEMETQGSKDTSTTTLASNNEVKDGGNVIDLLQMVNPTQIRLEAQVIAIRPEDTKNLGILYTGTGDFDAPGKIYAGESYADGDFRNNPFKWLINSRSNLNMRLEALITQNKAKILSRPSIMTMSGEQATIQIGGKIPYTVLDSLTNIATVKFKNYGIILQFKPILDAQNRIATTIHTEVSNMSGETINGMPVISTRRADSVVTLENGSTMIIGGLMDSSERKVVTKVPLLSKIPIIGEFFKHTSKTKDNQELVILVTPHIVEDSTHAGMTDEMRDYYHEGQRKQNNLNDVDLNALPPPFTEEDKKSKKNKKSKKSKEKQAEEKNSNEDSNVQIFGDAF
ncbi:MAG: hypothetical protein IJT73_10065 [Selenomonadaceae bacterium]|nr:hypothetical protein [Selenomonadaceae bacterium]